jgi:hypothetical protein
VNGMDFGIVHGPKAVRHYIPGRCRAAVELHSARSAKPASSAIQPQSRAITSTLIPRGSLGCRIRKGRKRLFLDSNQMR